MTDATLIHLPLEALHEKAGARFGGFAGWKMPLTYPLGVMGEHLATRQKAGLFDISHMKLIAVSGAEAAAFLSRACPIDAADLGIGRSKYSFLLNPAAGILDDVIVTRLGRERFMIVANAANAAGDIAHLTAIAADFAVEVEPLERVLLAMQGPEAAAVLTGSGLDSVLDLAFMQGAEPRQGWFMSRSGYTGEDGFEIALPEPMPRRPSPKPCSPIERVSLDRACRARQPAARGGLCLHGQRHHAGDRSGQRQPMWAIPKPPFAPPAASSAPTRWPRLPRRGRRESRVGLKPDGRPAGPRRRAALRRRRQPRSAMSPRADSALRPAIPSPWAMSPRRSPGRAHGFRRCSRHRLPVDVSPLCPSLRIATAKDNLTWPTTYFTEDHEWIRVEGDIATVGITDYAQEQLGDLVFVELPETGREMTKGDTAVVVESVKAASDVYAPVDGEIIEANATLSSDPSLVNSARDRRRLAVEDEARR